MIQSRFISVDKIIFVLPGLHTKEYSGHWALNVGDYLSWQQVWCAAVSMDSTIHTLTTLLRLT